MIFWIVSSLKIGLIFTIHARFLLIYSTVTLRTLARTFASGEFGSTEINSQNCFLIDMISAKFKFFNIVHL